MRDESTTILIVEDEAHDVAFLERAFQRSGVNNPVRSVENGEQAVAYLRGDGKYADRKAFPFPRVIVTDLKMPQMTGIELLQWIEANPKYRVIPTVILTSSTAKQDVIAAFKAGASGYMIKPVGFEQLQTIAKTIADYWRLSLVPDRED